LSAGQVSSIAKALSLQGHSTIGLVVWFGALTACGCSAGTTLFVQNQVGSITPTCLIPRLRWRP
ncbi:hypothetical protein PN498_13185, partial [Oscillatoria sp. CS-180]|uniref:hypothetical protein n=1 Tax=Oscillatoria sp. CS-180 TaxID=3021720 RepID=UPI00232F9B81